MIIYDNFLKGTNLTYSHGTKTRHNAYFGKESFDLEMLQKHSGEAT